MATTTNYGWTTPDDTALVKDGAAAIRTLGSSIDSTLKTQIDAQIPDSLLTTKGDLIAATGASTPARLAVGSNDQVLTADSTAATGMKWATPVTGAPAEDWALISSQTASGSTITWSSLGSYNKLYLMVNFVSTTAGTNDIYFDVNGSTGNNFAIGGIKYNYSSNLVINPYSSSAIRLTILKSASSYTSMSAGIILNNCKATTGNKPISVVSSTYAAANDEGYSLNGLCTISSAITSVSVTANGTTFNGGTMRLYGSTV